MLQNISLVICIEKATKCVKTKLGSVVVSQADP